MAVQQVAGNFAYSPYSFTTVPRFSPKYWSCNGPLSARMGLVSSTGAIKCSCELQKYSDFVGILWFSKDQFSHPLLQYIENTDYSGTTLSFTYSTSSNFTSFSDPTAEPIMTVTYTNGSVEYVSLIRYAAMGYTDHSANVTINFDTFVAGSFYSGPGTPIPATGIAQLEFGIFAQGYNPTNNSVISTGAYTPGTLIWLELSNIAASTNSGGNPANALMQVGNYAISPLTGVGIANDYDSTYNVTPQLLVENFIALGFSYVDHYTGVRPYSLVWNSGTSSFIINASGGINNGYSAWHTDFANRLTAAGIPFTFAMSFELYTADIPANWDQQDWNNNSAETGYANPTTSARFMDSTVGGFLQTLFAQTVALVPSGAQFTAQLGEYAWWAGTNNGPTHATIGPCIFDYATRVAYNTDTGLFAPEILSIVPYASLDSAQQAYVDWCRGALGAYCDTMAAAIIASRPGTKISALFYYDAISDQADPANGFMQQLNIPYEHWEQSHGTLTTIEGEMYGDTTPTFISADLVGLYETLTGTTSVPPQLGFAGANTTFYTGLATNPDASENQFENFTPMTAAANAAATMGFGIVYWWAWTQFQESGFYLQTPPPTPPEPPPPGPPLPPSPLTKILPAYPYQQYQDDPNIVAFFTAYNQLAQPYLDWFNTVPLALYTSPNVTGSLLDWIGNGIYGIPRPVFSNLTTRFHGAALDGVPLNSIAINGSRSTSSGGAVLATDDFYKRVITWLTYVGDGRMFNAMVLRKRIARFLFGVNGTDITLSQAQAVHINFASPTEFFITIPASANPASAYFAEAFNSGILAFPFQLSAEIVIA